ncbi:MAG: amidohydrolase family protein [Bacilli bacterium]|nr:amidohydrolase family protein [Bacilli bacterium]MBN2877316.1 amidohydrolase family protein [Bacilli bacterium]
MIIDTHAHVGKMLNFDLPLSDLLHSMEQYHIDYSLISSIEGAEFDHDRIPIPIENQWNQIEYNQRLLDNVHLNSDKLGALLWVKPNQEKPGKELQDLIEKNRSIIYGIKFHPYHSQIRFDDDRVLAYIRIAKKYDLPVVTHTASSIESSPRLVYEVAKQFPKVNFVMVHMGLGTNNLEAIDLISRLPNLYGDTTWVDAEMTIKAIRRCGSNKIIFGTDNTIDGIDTLKKSIYEPYFSTIQSKLSQEEYLNLMSRNAIRLFRLPL